MTKKSGMKVDELYVSVGADLSELDADFALADKTVRQAMAQLNRQNTKVKLQAEIDLSKATTEEERFAIKQKQIQEQLRIVAERIKITNVEYQNMVKDTTAASASSQTLENALLRQRKAYAELDAQLKKVNIDRKMAAEGGISQAPTFSKASEGGATELAAGGALGMVGGKIAGYATLAYGAYQSAKQGIQYANEAIDGSVRAGNAVFLLGQRYHIATDEAARMNLAFKVTGTDANEAVPALTRLDRQLLTAGANGNATTQALQKFGVSLESAPGLLVPMNEQLSRLAEGYKRASEQGMAQEYVAEVLGQRGLALLPILSQWAEVQDHLSKIKTTGLLDPERARKVFMLQQDLNAQLMQLKLAVGNALMPVAEDVLPKIIALAGDMAESISKNKESIKDVANAFVAAGGVIMDVLRGISGFLGAIGLSLDNVAGGLNRIRYMNGGSNKPLENVVNGGVGVAGGFAGMKAGAAIGTAIGGPLGTIGGGAIGAIGGYLAAQIGYSELFGGPSGYNAAQNAKIGSHTTMTADELSARGNAKGLQQSIQQMQQQQKQAEQIAQAKADAEKAAEEKKAAEIAKINEELTNKLYGLTHSQLETNLHAIDVEMQAYRDKGASEELIEQATAEHKAKIRQEFEDSVASQINRVWKSNLQARLDDIDRERRAYIQKGIDEVNAARWAEHEKRMAVVNEAKQAFKERREEMDAMRQAMASGGTMEERMGRARMAMLDIRRKREGITDDMRTSPEEMAMYSNLSRDVDNNLWPGLEVDAWARNMAANQIEIIKGNTRSMVNPALLSMGGNVVSMWKGTQSSQMLPQQGGMSVTVTADIRDNIIDNDLTKTKIVNDIAGKFADKLEQSKDMAGWNDYSA